MKSVNPYFLHSLLEPLTGLADDDEAVVEYAKVNPNSEQEVREIIRRLIVPHCASMSEKAVERTKLAYRYYLSKPGSNFERVYYSNLPPFNAPDDPRLIFVWIWEECFPGEDFKIDDLSGYVEKPDVNEPLRT